MRMDELQEKTENYQNILREQFIADQRRKGYVIVVPRDNQLQIDIDTREQLSVYHKQIAVFARGIPISQVMFPSKGGGEGYHITITLAFDVSPLERIALQAALGSDPMRELLSLMRFKNGDDHPTLFVENPDNFGVELSDVPGIGRVLIEER